MRKEIVWRFGFWAWFALFVAAATVLQADMSRFRPPIGEKYVFFNRGGAVDLTPSLNSGTAFLKGENPYHYDPANYPGLDPTAGDDAKRITFLYPPSHFLVYLPLVTAFGHVGLNAGRFHYYLSFGLLLVLSLTLLELVNAMIPVSRELRLALVPLLVFVLALHPGSALGIERAQSDFITAVFCWGALAAYQRGWIGTGAFLAVASALLKGYGLILAAGLLTAGLGRDSWRATFAGVFLAIALLLAPVARFLPDALGAYAVRSEMFWSNWTNQGFFNLVYTLKPQVAFIGQYVLTGFGIVVTAVTWLPLRNSLRRDQPPASRAFWLTLFGLASLTVVIGYSRNSIAYNLVIILPGLLILAMSQGRILLGASAVLRGVVGVGFAFALFGLCGLSIPRAFGFANVDGEVPIGGLAMVLILILIGVISVRALLSGTRSLWGEKTTLTTD
jgi:uncharacterized protein YhhL (DUF1145 family)